MPKFKQMYHDQDKLQQFTHCELQPYKNPKRGTYEVTVIHMHGDADHYTTNVSDFSTRDIDKMLKYVNFILRCMVAYPNGMGGDDGYWDIEGYEEHEEYFYQDNESCDGHASPDSMEIVYYDVNSVKFHVNFLT
jgi:hypothetical protein